jgi:Zn-dependent protease with chaperone function
MGTATAMGLGALDGARPLDALDASPGALEVVRAMTLRALWVAPAAFVAVLLATALLARLVVRDVDGTWTERARQTYPMRKVMRVVAAFVALLPATLAYFALQRTLPAAERRLVALAVLACSLLPLEIVRERVESRVNRTRIGLLRWLTFKTTYLPIRAPHQLVAFASAALLPHASTPAAWALALLALLALLVSGTGVAWLPMRAIGLIRPAPARVVAAVAAAVRRVGVRPRAVDVVPTYGVPFANAFAIPHFGRIAFTDDAIALLSDEELAAIAAHELGHVRESRAVAWGRSMLAVMLAPIAVAPVVHAALGLWGLGGAFALSQLAGWGYRRWSLGLEARADGFARASRASHAPHAPHEEEAAPSSREGPASERAGAVYARALERLYERNLAPAAMPGASGAHPQLYDRLLAAGVTPAYPRPQPPDQRREVQRGVLVLVGFACVLDVAFVYGQRAFEREAGRAYAAAGERALRAGDRVDAGLLNVEAQRLSASR